MLWLTDSTGSEYSYQSSITHYSPGSDHILLTLIIDSVDNQFKCAINEFINRWTVDLSRMLSSVNSYCSASSS